MGTQQTLKVRVKLALDFIDLVLDAVNIVRVGHAEEHLKQAGRSAGLASAATVAQLTWPLNVGSSSAITI
jgi:hypothetical protein